jgi:hypothetical protein
VNKKTKLCILIPGQTLLRALNLAHAKFLQIEFVVPAFYGWLVLMVLCDREITQAGGAFPCAAGRSMVRTYLRTDRLGWSILSRVECLIKPFGKKSAQLGGS